jgi:hypothetical protein
VATRTAIGPADRAGSLHTSLEIDMEKTRRRLDRARRHAERLSQEALKGAGSRRAAGQALGRSESTVSHECTSRAHPAIAEVMSMLIMLNGFPGTTGRAIRNAVVEAQELHDIVHADDETLIARGLYLLAKEDLLESAENGAAKARTGYSEALRAEGHAQIELAAVMDELEYRGLCLWAEAQRRAS